MRALFAGSVCLLAAATASAQPLTAPLSPTSPPATLGPLTVATQPPPTPTTPGPPPAALNLGGPGPTLGLPSYPTIADGMGQGAPIPLYDAPGGNPWAMTHQGFWAQADYLLWWITPMNTPSLIQTVPSAAAVASATNGTTLAAGTTQRYFPPTDRVEFGGFSGARLSTGYNFESFGIDASAFFLNQKTKSNSLYNDGTPVSVAESYIRAGTGTPVSLFGSLAGQYSGGVSSAVSSQVWGVEGNVRVPWFMFLTTNTDAIAGFRYLEVLEHVTLVNNPTFSNGTTLVVSDSFKTRNDFYGGQIGLDGRIGPTEHGFGMNLLGKIGLGDVHQQATLDGSNTYTTPGMPADYQAGGLFARGANMGVFNRDRFAAVFELNTTLTYNFTRWAQAYVGYSVTWLSSVQRPGDLINTTINDSQIRFIANAPASNVNQPVFTWRGTDFTTQGITIGLKFQY